MTNESAPAQVDVEVTFKLVVGVPEGYTQDDVANAVNEYIHETGSLPEPVSVVGPGVAGAEFFRTVYQIEVLSDVEPPSFPTLEQIAYDITEGHSSGVLNEISREGVDRKRIAELLTAQGSDPSFLLGDDYEDEDSNG